MSRNANDQGRFGKVKTRLTTKEEEEGEERGGYIHVACQETGQITLVIP